MNEKEINKLVPEWTRLLKSLKADIHDDCRASDDSEDTLPGMCVTIGFTPSDEDADCSWHYQTGDNSFTGAHTGTLIGPSLAFTAAAIQRNWPRTLRIRLPNA